MSNLGKYAKKEEISLQIIFSQFDEKRGPYAMVYFPKNISIDTQDRVSSNTIDLFTDTDYISNIWAIMSFPQLKKNGLIKIFDWDDPTLRGGKNIVTLTILFEENDDSILYKYKDDIQEQVNKFLIDFQPLVQKKEKVDILQKELKKCHKNIQDFLLKLAYQEPRFASNLKEFPKTQEQSMKKDYAFKTIVIGDPGVGKTTMVFRSTGQAFRKSYLPTIGTNIEEKFIRLHDTEFVMVLWDVAGQVKFDKLRTKFYKGAKCVIIVFDLTKSESFENVKKWYSDVKSNISYSNELEVILCGNKSDLKEEIQISEEKVLNLASELNVDYLETSARNMTNIEKIFVTMINNIISKGLIQL